MKFAIALPVSSSRAAGDGNPRRHSPRRIRSGPRVERRRRSRQSGQARWTPADLGTLTFRIRRARWITTVLPSVSSRWACRHRFLSGYILRIVYEHRRLEVALPEHHRNVGWVGPNGVAVNHADRRSRRSFVTGAVCGVGSAALFGLSAPLSKRLLPGQHSAELAFCLRLQRIRRADRGRSVVPIRRVVAESDDRQRGHDLQLGVGHRKRAQAAARQALVPRRVYFKCEASAVRLYVRAAVCSHARLGFDLPIRLRRCSSRGADSPVPRNGCSR